MEDLINKTVAACQAEIQRRAKDAADQGLRLQGAADGVTFLAQELQRALAEQPAAAAAPDAPAPQEATDAAAPKQ